MTAARQADEAPTEAVRVSNRHGRSPYVLVVDHASNFVPPQFGRLGLPESDLVRHIAWDPGALPVAARMARALDAALVESLVSRLVVDTNRPLDAPDLIWEVSESTEIPGNRGLGAASRQERIALAWEPFHAAIRSVVEGRLASGRATWIVSVHSFTPVYRGVARPWHIGIIHDEDERLAAPLIAALEEEIPGIEVGVNQPYAPADRVYYTLERHARSRGLPCAMVEIRNDQIADTAGQQRWAELLARILGGIRLLEDTSHPIARKQLPR